MLKLNNDDKARLAADFIVPLVVAQMMTGLEPLDDVAEYTLHDILGDLRPDGGLLCLALCAAEIAAHFPHMPIAGALALEADRAITEFGSYWLTQDDADTHMLRQSLMHLPEDLEALADLLDATQSALMPQLTIPRTLCDMLALQARAHAEAAEDELFNINLMPLSREQVGATIVPFPART